MTRWRSSLILVLLALPVVALVAVGAQALWMRGDLWWVGWLLPVCWGIAYLLSRGWRTATRLPPGTDLPPATHWTPQDEQALQLVQTRQRAVTGIAPEKLSDPHFLLGTATDLSLEIARHYHPRAVDPLSSVTVLETLAVVHLVAEDLEQLAETYVPGSHLLTIQQWRMLTKAPDWFRVASDVSWMVAMLFQPARIARYVLSTLTTRSASKQAQTDLLAWFYVLFVRQVGYYLIELNSGRLRAGAANYRKFLAQLRRPDVAASPTAGAGPPGLRDEAARGDAPPGPADLTVAVVGQAKAGKSSLVNALLGQRRAETDVLPQTHSVQRFQLRLPSIGDRVVLLDTPGYAADEVTDWQLSEIRTAFQQSDLVLLVLRATNPARQADLNLIQQLAQWFGAQPQLKPPRVLAVLTHIDGLSPVLEWSPPYQWQTGTGAKEQSIRGAVEYTGQLFGYWLSGAVPACTDVDRDRVYGVHEWVLPAMAALVDHARATALVRTLHKELDSGQLLQVVAQLYNAGTRLLTAYFQSYS